MQQDFGIEFLRQHLLRLDKEREVFQRVHAADKSMSRLSESLHLDNLEFSLKFLHMECVAAGSCRQLHQLVNELLLIPPHLPQVWDSIIREVIKFRPSIDADDDIGKNCIHKHKLILYFLPR
jgi:hypothetical protein